MKSKLQPYEATGRTIEPLEVTFGASGSILKYTVTVPANTRCIKLVGGSDPWVVLDLSFIEDQHSLLYREADVQGIRIPEDKLTDIRPA